VYHPHDPKHSGDSETDQQSMYGWKSTRYNLMGKFPSGQTKIIFRLFIFKLFIGPKTDKVTDKESIIKTIGPQALTVTWVLVLIITSSKDYRN
jgi:hypothetical protein